MTKLLENTFRHINIALINELAVLCRDLGIDIWEVIDAAATKPFGFMPFYPGPGVGGHCIPVDPMYLSWRVRQLGSAAKFIELARDVNASMPRYVATRVQDILNDGGKAVRGAKIHIVGVAYKSDIGDMRESPAVALIDLLVHRGAAVTYSDPFISELVLADTSILRHQDLDEAASVADCIVIVTAHSGVDHEGLGLMSGPVLDTRNAIRVRHAGVHGL